MAPVGAPCQLDCAASDNQALKAGQELSMLALLRTIFPYTGPDLFLGLFSTSELDNLK